jgi:hypothetical protein
MRHTLEGETTGTMRLAWPLVWRPMHDALIEDALDTAEASLSGAAIARRRLSRRVRLFRALARRVTSEPPPPGESQRQRRTG